MTGSPPSSTISTSNSSSRLNPRTLDFLIATFLHSSPATTNFDAVASSCNLKSGTVARVRYGQIRKSLIASDPSLSQLSLTPAVASSSTAATPSPTKKRKTAKRKAADAQLDKEVLGYLSTSVKIEPRPDFRQTTELPTTARSETSSAGRECASAAVGGKGRGRKRKADEVSKEDALVAHHGNTMGSFHNRQQSQQPRVKMEERDEFQSVWTTMNTENNHSMMPQDLHSQPHPHPQHPHQNPYIHAAPEEQNGLQLFAGYEQQQTTDEEQEVMGSFSQMGYPHY